MWPSVFKSRMSRGEAAATVRAPSAEHSTTRAGESLSVMAEPDNAVIQLKPFEESQRPTESPTTRCYNNKGILRTFFNPRTPKQTTDTADVHVHAPLCYCFLFIHNVYLFFPLHLSINVHVTPLDVYAPIHHSLSLIVAQSSQSLSKLFSSFVIICLLICSSRLCLILRLGD